MTHTYAAYRRPTSEQKTYTEKKTLKVKGWKKNNSKQMDRKKKLGRNSHIRQNRFQSKGHKNKHRRTPFIILKGRIHQEDINIINIHVPNIGPPKYIRKILEYFEKGIDSNILIVGHFNIPLSTMDRSSKQNINKDIVSLNITLDEMDLTDI